jgi:hypothetical protein
VINWCVNGEVTSPIRHDRRNPDCGGKFMRSLLVRYVTAAVEIGMPTLDSGEHRSEAGGQAEGARDTPRSVPLESAAATAPRTVEDALGLAAKLAIGEGAYERAMAVLELLVARAHDVEVARGSGGRSGRRSARRGPRCGQQR